MLHISRQVADFPFFAEFRIVNLCFCFFLTSKSASGRVGTSEYPVSHVRSFLVFSMNSGSVAYFQRNSS